MIKSGRVSIPYPNNSSHIEICDVWVKYRAGVSVGQVSCRGECGSSIAQGRVWVKYRAGVSVGQVSCRGECGSSIVQG